MASEASIETEKAPAWMRKAVIWLSVVGTIAILVFITYLSSEPVLICEGKERKQIKLSFERPVVTLKDLRKECWSEEIVLPKNLPKGKMNLLIKAPAEKWLITQSGCVIPMLGPRVVRPLVPMDLTAEHNRRLRIRGDGPITLTLIEKE